MRAGGGRRGGVGVWGGRRTAGSASGMERAWSRVISAMSASTSPPDDISDDDISDDDIGDDDVSDDDISDDDISDDDISDDDISDDDISDDDIGDCDYSEDVSDAGDDVSDDDFSDDISDDVSDDDFSGDDFSDDVGEDDNSDDVSGGVSDDASDSGIMPVRIISVTMSVTMSVMTGIRGPGPDTLRYPVTDNRVDIGDDIGAATVNVRTQEAIERTTLKLSYDVKLSYESLVSASISATTSVLMTSVMMTSVRRRHQ